MIGRRGIASGTGSQVRSPAGVSLVLSAGILLVASLPYFSIDEGFSGVSTMPDEAESKQAFLILDGEFSGGLGSPVEIVITGPCHAAGGNGRVGGPGD